jgi:pimeloyl-ACP methyl ester carboxylesterase
MMIDVGGVGIEAQWWGEASETTVVMLHEGLGCVALWRDFPEVLASVTGFRTFAWSRPGYGGSDAVGLPRPLDYMEVAAREDVPAVLDAAGIGACLLVGHSDGASIAALADDSRIIGKILISPHYFVEDSGLAAIGRAVAAYESGDLRERLAKYHAHVDVAFRGWAGAWLDPGFRGWDIRDRIAVGGVPVLQIQGDDDPYGTTAQTDAVTGDNVTTVVLAAKHAPHFEAAPQAVLAIETFLVKSGI